MKKKIKIKEARFIVQSMLGVVRTDIFIYTQFRDVHLSKSIIIDNWKRYFLTKRLFGSYLLLLYGGNANGILAAAYGIPK